jgi:hypothetical protein
MKLQILIQGDSDSDVERSDEFESDSSSLRKQATGGSPMGAKRAEPRDFMIKSSSKQRM